MGKFYIQRCEDKAINVFDKYKLNIKGIEISKELQETELGNSIATYNTVIETGVHINQMNLLSNFTTYISNRIRGQYDKAKRGEPKDGAFQLIDVENNIGYRLTYVNMRDTGKKDGKWKTLELLFMNDVPQATLDVSEGISVGNIPCDLYFADGCFIKGIRNRYIPYKSEWALIVPFDGKPYLPGTSVLGSRQYIENSQSVERIEEDYVLKCSVIHEGTEYQLISYNRGESWFMLKPLMQDFRNRKESIHKFPSEMPVMYYGKNIIPELNFPDGFELLTLKDVLALQSDIDRLGRWNDFYNKYTMYGFVEYLHLNNKTERSAFWCKDNKGEVTGFQFIQKGNRIVAERIYVESYTYLPVIGIYKNND